MWTLIYAFLIVLDPALERWAENSSSTEHTATRESAADFRS